MNAYEITFIVRPDLDEEQTRSAVAQVSSRLESTGGEIIALYPWSPARRRMAYPIRDFGDGFYTTATFRAEPSALRDFENALKLNENVLRFLVVQASEAQIRQSQQRAQQQAAAAAAPPPGAHPVPATPAAPEPATAVPEGTAVASEPLPAAVQAEPAIEAPAVESQPVDTAARPVAEPVATAEGEE